MLAVLMRIDKPFVTLCCLIISAILFINFGSTVNSIPLTKPLEVFPKVVGSFKRINTQSFSEAVKKTAGMDDYIMWQYQDAQGYTLGLYIGYYQDQIEGGIIHSPKHCMPGSGWQPFQVAEVTTKATDGKTYRIARMVMQKGDDKQVAHYWFQGRGRVIANEYEDRVAMILDSILRRRSDGALVRITGPGSDGEQDSQKQMEFIEALLPKLVQFLPQ